MIVGRAEIVPITLREAHAFVAKHHRHHKPDRGARFAIGAARNDEIVAVAVVGRPKARRAQDTWTAEVTRLCSIDASCPVDSDGKRHAASACSMLYAACWRAAKAMGYRRLITYTLPEEGGVACAALAGKRSARRVAARGTASRGPESMNTRRRSRCDGRRRDNRREIPPSRRNVDSDPPVR